jgi:hypothetical protein
MEQTARLAIIAIAAAIGVIWVVVTVETFVTPLLQQQEAEARGCENVPRNISQNATAFIVSQGRCFGHGPP